MNELVSAECGKLVAVERYQPRRDGYYWPQGVVSIEDLRRQMEWYCENAERLPELKRAAREHAVQHLDWSRNGQELSGILERVSRIESESRRRARTAALQFEKQRTDVRLFYPLTTRVLLKAARYLRPLASRSSGR